MLGPESNTRHILGCTVMHRWAQRVCDRDMLWLIGILEYLQLLFSTSMMGALGMAVGAEVGSTGFLGFSRRGSTEGTSCFVP